MIHKVLIGLCVTLNPIVAYSACYIASDMAGFSVHQAEGFDFRENEFAGKEFRLNFNGESGSVSLSELECFPIGTHTLFCADSSGGPKAVIETWAVYPTEGVVLHTKIVNGYGKFNTAQVFKGKLQGLCE